jgi:SET domain-containing protein
MNDVFIGKGNLDGKGIFAARDFKKDEVIIKYNLKAITQEEFDNLPESEKEFTHAHNGQIHLYSVPERYVNHSENPNTYQDFENWADVALRDIKKGEEITTDATKDDI